MHGVFTEEIARFEKYRVGYEYALNQLPFSVQAQRFGRFYAVTDWDDPAAAWIDWHRQTEVR